MGRVRDRDPHPCSWHRVASLRTASMYLNQKAAKAVLRRQTEQTVPHPEHFFPEDRNAYRQGPDRFQQTKHIR